MSSVKAKDSGAFLPLRPVEFQILVSLTRGERHGYGIIQDAEGRGEGSPVPGLATLYRALQRLERAGLIERSGYSRQAEGDDRRRLFRLTDLGLHVTRAEASRLASLIRVAAEADLFEGSPAHQ